MKHERLIALADLLLSEGRATAEELSRRFEVSVRTIYRDVDALCTAGVPIIALPGAGGGYQIDPDYRVDRSFLTKDEIADVSAVLKGFAESSGDRALSTSLAKIASLGRRGASGGGLPPPLIASPSAWGAPLPDPRDVALLRRSIADGRVVAFSYADAEGRPTEREVEPFSIALGGAAWYLHGWCRLRGAFRLFRLSRMRDLRAAPARFDPETRLPVPDPFGRDAADAPDLAGIAVSVAPALRAAVEDALPWARAEEGSGHRTVYRFEYPLGPFLVRQLLGFGPGLRVLEPEGLRDALRDAAREMAEDNSFALPGPPAYT